MRSFDYLFLKELKYSSKILKLLCEIEKKKSIIYFFEKDYPVVLNNLKDIALIDSALSSLALDGIFTSDKEILELKKKSNKSELENEIVGYTKAQEYISENPDYNERIIKKTHSLNFDGTNKVKGEYKNKDNVLIEILPNKEKKVIFVPISANETDLAIYMQSNSYATAKNEKDIHALILAACTLFDYICIMPFKEGNGRMSRLIANLLLLKSNYDVNRFISIDDVIYNTHEKYLKACELSRITWNENTNDYIPFIEYFLDVVNTAYSLLCERYELTGYTKISKADRIRKLFLEKDKHYSKEDIYRMWPDMVYNTIELEISKMIKEGLITKIGTTKDAKYVRR